MIPLAVSDQSPATTGSNDDVIECSEDFYLREDGCRAECGRFEYWPHNIEDLFNIALIVALVIGTTVGVIVIAVSCIQRKTL
jgi:hypothetical protein